MSDVSESEASEYVPSEEDTIVVAPKSEETRKAKPLKRGAKKQALGHVVASPRKQLSARKRHGSRVSPPSEKKAAPKAKKPRVQSESLPKVSPEGEKAVNRVDAAIPYLPAEADLNFSFMEQSGRPVFGRGTEVPEHHGTKTVPEGHPECLAGKTFVISGVLESLTRVEAEHLIKRHGGRVTSAVSGKTSFLVVGQECGQSKYEKAQTTGTKLVDENGLFQLIRAGRLSDQGSPAMEPASAKSNKMEIDKPTSSSRPGGDESMGQELWVDKYKPEALSDLVGNPSIVKFLCAWLEQWYSCHILHQPFSDPSSFGNKHGDLTSKKAVLLNGPPGIGKTTASLLVAREVGFEAIEVNASDTRNKADKTGKGGIAGKRSNQVKALCQNARIGDAGSTDKNSTVLIMDEVDGMSAGDRGGVTDLIENIKGTKIPIICICNDKYNRKLTSLRNHCIELDFRRPTRLMILKRMKDICRQEGLNFASESTMEALIDQAHGDLRTLIGGLQVIRATTTSVSYPDVENGTISIQKNHDVNPFEAARSLISAESSLKSWNELSDTVFNDMDLIPLLVQENYVNHIPKSGQTERGRLKAMARAARYLSFGERIQSEIRSQQKWSLMPSAVHMGTLAPASIMRGPREKFYPHEMNFTRFTAFLGNLSATNKQLRLLQTAVTRMAATSKQSIDREAAVLDYFPTLRCLLTYPLVEEHSEGILAVFDLMKAYCIDKCAISTGMGLLRCGNRDHYDYIMDVTQFKGSGPWAENPLPSIPAKVKTALTRQVNAAQFICSAIPADAEATRAPSKTEESQDDTFNPESSVIRDTIKEEVKEEEIDPDQVVADMKQSGYQLKLSGESARASTSTTGRGRASGKRAARGRGRTSKNTRGRKK